MNKTGNYFLFPVKSEKKQDGFVLILVLVMLAILSLLGAMVLNSTDTELALTSNYRSSNDAFVVSQLGVEYSKGLVVDEYWNLSEGDNYNIDDEDDVKGHNLSNLLEGLNLSGIELVSTSGNEIDHYLAAGTSRRSATQSADNTTNVYTTTESGGAQDVPYYRISVDVTARGRASSRLEAVVERIANTSL